MSNMLPLFCLALIIPMVFVVGVLVGSTVRNNHRYKLVLNQNQGEAAVRKIVIANFKPPNFHLLNNVTIPFQDGTTQIDHILISTKGIFVLETKHYKGWIYGDEKSKTWTQVTFHVKNQFQNPLRQNYRHIKVLQELLDFLPKEQIHSIVVFTGDGVFRSELPKKVVYLHQLVDYLQPFQDDVISLNQVEFCIGRLEHKRYEITKATDIQHRAYLAKKFNDAN